MLSEKGSLKETPVMKLLLGIFEQAFTGILYIKKEEILKVLYFNRGKLIWAISNSDEDKLENILAARNLVDPSTLLKVKRESHVSETIGKILVEKGLITLEELIESSKIQLKRIISSILKWKTGGFQFVKDAPPERLLSLDLSITNFIIDFILDEMDISSIWKEIGSLQVELMKNPDEKKLSKYRLSEKQITLLNSFNGKDKLETILSRYSGGHRESLLKIIYFFLMSELVIKKEFELADASEFDGEGAGFESFHTEKTKPEKNGSMKTNQAEDTTDSFKFDSWEKDEPKSNLSTPDSNIPVEEEVHNDNDTKTKKIKIITLILIIFILILGGIILLILPSLLNENPMDRMKSNFNTGSTKGEIINIEEQKPVIEKAENQKIENPETKTPSVQENIQENVHEKSLNSLETKPVPDVDSAVSPPNLPSGKSAMAYFQEGSMITAGDIWKQELKNAGIMYSILLELDCQKESVVDAFDRVEAKEEFFILNKPTRERTCFLVLWGKYQNRQEAEEDLKSVPKYFWNQPNPPEVIDVTKYL